MMKGKIKGLISLTLAGALAVGMAGCGGSKDDKAAATAAATAGNSASAQKELYKMDVFTMLGNKAGEQTGWFAKVIKDKFNVEMNMIASNVEGGDTKFATMMASGNLGDMVIFGSDSDNKWQDAIKAKAILDWNSNGLLEKYGKDITANYGKALEKNKINFGGGSAVYGLGHSAANMPAGPSEGKDMTEHSDLRWDLYEKIGKPAINSPEELLDVLKKMQAAEPKSESGKPTYAFSMWGDWDSTWMMNVKVFAALYGFDAGDGFNDTGFLLFNPTTGETQTALDPDGWYMKTLKLYNKAYQMGLVDPDSISQKYEDVQNKYKDGQILFCWFPWLDSMYNTQERVAAGKGFKFVPIKGEKVISYSFDTRGGNRVISIGAKAKKPERVMEVINWMYTPEGAMTLYNGPKGLTWDMKDGKPVLTDFGKKALPNNPVEVPAAFGGGNFKDGQSGLNYEPVNRNAINPETKEPYDYNIWTSVLKENPTKLEASWREAMGGALSTKEYLIKNDMVALKKPVFMGKPPENRPETLVQKQGQVATVVKQYSWKCIFAKDDAQYNQLVDEMTKKAKGLGYDEVAKWNKDHAQQVVDFLKTEK